MRIECDSCHELVAGRFAIEGDRIIATCPTCRTRVVVSSAEPEVSQQIPLAPDAADKPRCPKCDRVRAGETACPGCGLAADRMPGFAASRDADVPAAVHAAWDRVAEHWTDDAARDELFKVVSANGQYAWAAQRYRTAGKLHPDGDIAARELERMRKAAEVTLFISERTIRASKQSPYKNTVGILVVLLLLMVSLVLYAVVMSSSDADDTGTAPPAQVR